MTTHEEPMLGQLTIARGLSRVYPAFVLLMIFGIGFIVFGALGGPAYFDTTASPDERARMIALMRPRTMVMGLVPLLVGLGLFIYARVDAARVEASTPTGPARRDPYAWLMHIARLGAGSWRGPCSVGAAGEGRTVVIQRIARRRAASGLRLAVELGVPTRVSWSRRPISGAALDRAAGLTTEEGANHGFPDLEVSMLERPWALALFEQPGVRDAVRTLTMGESTVLVILRPGRLFVQYPFGNTVQIDGARMRAWVDALCHLAASAEAISEPRQPAERTSVERLADQQIGAT